MKQSTLARWCLAVAVTAIAVACETTKDIVNPRFTLAPPNASGGNTTPLPTCFTKAASTPSQEYPPPLGTPMVWKLQVYNCNGQPFWIALDTTLSPGYGGFIWSAQCGVDLLPCIIIRADGWLNPPEQTVAPSAIVSDSTGAARYYPNLATGALPDTSFIIRINWGSSQNNMVFETGYWSWIQPVYAGSGVPLKTRVYDNYPSALDTVLTQSYFVADDSGAFRFASCKAIPKTRCRYP